jgi:ribosomal protein L29
MAKAIKDKSIADLTKELFEKKESLRALKSNGAGTKDKNVKAQSTLRKDIARILTAINANK